MLTASRTTAMIMCRCGDMFRASGSHASVQRKQQAWEAQHTKCAEKKRAGRKVFWLSFCDAARPKGQQFLGACLVDVTAAEADAAAVDVLRRFPFAEPDAEWIAAAVKKAHRLGCNPGGEVATKEMPPDHPNLARYQFGVLMDRPTVTRIDREIAAGRS
jgi:hypothetical protein